MDWRPAWRKRAVPRQAGGTEIATGTIARIVGSQGDSLDLQLLGLGVVRYQRSEVARIPRAKSATPWRATTPWQALRPNVVLEAVVRSRAWAWPTSTPTRTTVGRSSCRSPGRHARAASAEDLVSADLASTYWEAD